jgi:trk system potassium uptake protein TrkH
VFHAISAFCNAGFALFPDNASLTALVADLGTVLVIGGLIVAGGLGYGVLAEIGGRAATLWRRRPHPGAVGPPGAQRAFSRHARWVLWSSGALIVAGALALWLLESQRGLVGLTPRGRWLAALFQSITLRTAGFNTVDLAAFGLPAVVLCIVWMLVGGSPGGTAGGVKTTPAAVGLATLVGRLRGEPRLRRRAARLSLLFVATYVVSCLLAAAAQGEWDRRLAFEVASALGTVGLSLGYTSELSTPAKLVIVLVMFAGRVGPFALAAALLRWQEQDVGRNEASPERRILVG